MPFPGQPLPLVPQAFRILRRDEVDQLLALLQRVARDQVGQAVGLLDTKYTGR